MVCLAHSRTVPQIIIGLSRGDDVRSTPVGLSCVRWVLKAGRWGGWVLKASSIRHIRGESDHWRPEHLRPESFEFGRDGWVDGLFSFLSLSGWTADQAFEGPDSGDQLKKSWMF